MATRLEYLFGRYLQQLCTPDEYQELLGLGLEPANQESLKILIDHAWEVTGESEDLPEERAEALMGQLFPITDTKVVDGRRRFGWLRVAAAVIVILLGTGAYLLFFNKPRHQDIVKAEPAKDVKAPESNRAMITLANGQTVYLDSAGNGQLANANGVEIVKLGDGRIAYNEQQIVNNEQLIYNTLTNPRGSKVIDMTLSDGSRVWLNAGSSITYPVSLGKERKVTMTGEAYFEVTHDEGRPFVVSKNNVSVTVLGTRFNVNSFEDEDDIKITLLEGSVRVRNGAETIIKPGEQAQAKKDGSITLKKNADIDLVMAWKNGMFSYSKTDISIVLRELQRWYDVDVVVEGKLKPILVEGKMQRALTLGQVLKILQRLGLNSKIEDRKLIIQD